MVEHETFDPSDHDDGVNSIGLWAAHEALKPIADVTVVAPATQQSAVGRSISIFEPLRATQVVVNGEKAGLLQENPLTPLSSVICLEARAHTGGEWDQYRGKPLDRVHHDLRYGRAALEASNQGPKAIAFSLQVEDQGTSLMIPGIMPEFRCGQEGGAGRGGARPPVRVLSGYRCH